MECRPISSPREAAWMAFYWPNLHNLVLGRGEQFASRAKCSYRGLKMGLKETLADLTAVGEKERQRREDAPQKLLAWLKEIDDLHAWVKDNLSEHASLRYGTKPIQLAENQLGGRYEANILLISAGSEERPVASRSGLSSDGNLCNHSSIHRRCRPRRWCNRRPSSSDACLRTSEANQRPPDRCRRF